MGGPRVRHTWLLLLVNMQSLNSAWEQTAAREEKMSTGRRENVYFAQSPQKKTKNKKRRPDRTIVTQRTRPFQFTVDWKINKQDHCGSLYKYKLVQSDVEDKNCTTKTAIYIFFPCRYSIIFFFHFRYLVETIILFKLPCARIYICMSYTLILNIFLRPLLFHEIHLQKAILFSIGSTFSLVATIIWPGRSIDRSRVWNSVPNKEEETLRTWLIQVIFEAWGSKKYKITAGSFYSLRERSLIEPRL